MPLGTARHCSEWASTAHSEHPGENVAVLGRPGIIHLGSENELSLAGMHPRVMHEVLSPATGQEGAVQPAVLSAIIASVTSLVVAVATAIAQRRMQRAKREQDAELEKFRNELSDLSAERTARRSYE